MKKTGLRIDVDTFRGTRYGVPNLLKVLNRYSAKASFFFSVGPDNMGRHLRRLIRPDFLFKMLRTKASKLYGWDILLRGTFWPGPVIGEKLGDIIRKTADMGHEIGLHAWDHHDWQTNIDKMSPESIRDSLGKGVDMLTKILGRPPVCSAVPGWRCSDQVLLEKSRFPFEYNSDCRGEDVFMPVVNGKELLQPQIPVTLPTYDEIIGSQGVTDSNYNEYIISLLDPEKINVLTIHAEVEGIAFISMFDSFMKMAKSEDISFIPLGDYLKISPPANFFSIISQEISGREGPVSCQAV